MDPVSAAISLAASLTTLIDVTSRLTEVIGKFKGLEKTLGDLSRDVNGLLMLVELLKKIIENVEGALDSLTVTQHNEKKHALPVFNGDVEEIAQELLHLLDSYIGQQHTGWTRWIRSLTAKSRYLFNE